jgi:glycosyltransferase involved in cell wall biosynthesis
MSERQRLKVVRIIARLNVGGPARQALLLHERLPVQGFDTVLVHGDVGAGEASLEGLIEERGLRSIRLPELGAQVRPRSDVRALLRLLRLLFAHRPDIVHTHTAKAGTLGRLAAFAFNATRSRAHRCLVVHTFHGNVLQGYFGRMGSLAVQVAERSLALLTDRIITISPSQRAEIAERFHVAPAHRVSVLRLGLDLDRFLAVGPVEAGLRGELGFPADSILFGSVGRLVAIKDLATLLRALPLARARDPRIRLVIVGDGPERPALEQLAVDTGLAGSVRFLGWRHDLVHLYGGLEVIALTSLNEGTPVALIEAMAAGLPVLATAVGGVPDVVADGHTGLLVPPRDPQAFADLMISLAAAPEERLRMGAAGRAAAARYGQAHLVEALTGLYRRELARKRRSAASAEAAV